MLRFWFVSLCVFVALAWAMLLTSAHAQQASSVAGEWSGKYICGQGITALKLNVSQKPDGALSATFNFGPLPENPTVPTGAYRMEGSFDPQTRKVKLRGVKWIDAPDNYVMVDLDGRMDVDGSRMSGLVPEWPGCTNFEVRRGPALIS